MDLHFVSYRHFNPRSLTGATRKLLLLIGGIHISIHAPSRERLLSAALRPWYNHFNPRSLTGATKNRIKMRCIYFISIHAPSRERHLSLASHHFCPLFQSTLPHGSDQGCSRHSQNAHSISIHAPSRERPFTAWSL